MTYIRVRRHPDLSWVEIKGHSKYAPEGYDIVCAGISALFCTLREALEKLSSSTVRNRESDGYQKIIIQCPDQEAQLLQRAFLIGVRRIAELYPDYVTVRAVR